jgi:hypothetical protein
MASAEQQKQRAGKAQVRIPPWSEPVRSPIVEVEIMNTEAILTA